MIKALASDLDGTLIPLDEDTQQRHHLQMLKGVLAEQEIELLFVTGRHADSAIAAIDEHILPQPQWIICNVGTTILKRSGDDRFNVLNDYLDELKSITANIRTGDLKNMLNTISALCLQEDYKQATYKLSYYVNSAKLHDSAEQVRFALNKQSAPWDLITSVDPFNGDGLIDVVPRGVSKSFALKWWTRQSGVQPEELVFAGDSGNDIAALTAGWNAILVSNAPPEVVDETQKIVNTSGHTENFFHSEHPASSGVFDGLQYFLSRR